MRLPYTLAAISLIALVATAPALAQDSSGEPPQLAEGEGDDIVVTAARTELPPSALPITIDVIGPDQLAEQVQVSGSVIDAVSALTPSFSPTRQKLSGAGESLRGRSPLFAINGIPQSTPLRDGSRDGFTIDPFFVDRVELIYGSNALQGIGATGGIVNQVTVDPPSRDGISGRALAQLTADSDFSGAAMGWKVAGLVGWRGGAFDATFGAAYERRGMFRDGEGRFIGVDGTQGEIQDSDSLSLFARLGWQVSDSARLDLLAHRFELEGNGDYVVVNGNRATGLPTSARRGVQDGVPPTNRTETLSLTLTDDELFGGSFTGQLFWNRSRDTFGGGIFADFQDPLIAPLGTLFDQSQNRSRKYGGKLAWERAVPGFDDLTLTLGFDALYDSTTQILAATGRPWVPETNYRSLAPFAQANLALFDGIVRLAGGARYENVEIAIPDFTTLFFYGRRRVDGGAPSFEDALLNGGIIVEPVDGIRAYASYAEGYTVADVGRITRAIAIDNVDIDTFLDISPVVSNNREIGVEVKRGPLDFSAAYFWSTSTRGQLLVLVGDVFQVQRQRVEIEGLEANVAVALPVDGLRASIGYAHLDGRTDSNGDGSVDIDLDGANISPDRVNAALSYASGPFSARVQTSWYLSRRFDGGDPRNSFVGYDLTDASVRYDTGYGTLSLAVANLFDTQYISYNSDTQRPTDNARFFAGRGRTVTLGWDWRF
jgi:iron complex outermembrane recepter protein